ncbi:MAG TPA: hypothetical protein VN612_01230 [Acidobacteriaceae bacterium]|nr:hypothetical protein [Acidobacteriaceae bacterium]
MKQWHQQGEALLTIENARSFLNAAGLVLFAPRPQIAAPAPSFVEAVAGASIATPTPAQFAAARELLARLVAEGLAVPLNLLGVGSVIGAAGDTPDFIAGAQVFSYIFTLRGDKGWKQPPQSSGAVKFSNLAIATYEALAGRGQLSAYELAGELGKEVTESAVLRSLGELWTHLRVLPLPQPDGSATVWELATARLTKQIKAGANAGLPTALSTLISLYLGQAIVASEDEIESFLSPLTARSRTRDVVHALLAARQLDTVAIEGKTMLHVAGAAPAFLSEEPTVAVGAIAKSDTVSESRAEDGEAAISDAKEAGETEPAERGSRIAKFVPRDKPTTRELAKARPAKFARKPFGETRKPFGEKKPFARREGTQRSSFRDSKGGRPFPERRGFNRSSEGGAERAPRGERPSFREEGKPRFEKKRFPPRDAEFKPRFARREGEGTNPQRERRPFVRAERGEGRLQGRSFERPERGDRRGRKPFDRTADDRPARRSFGGAEGGERRPRKPFERSGERPERKPFGTPNRLRPKREFGSGEEAGKSALKPRAFGNSKPYRKREEMGDRTKGTEGSFGAKRPFAGSARPAAGRPFRGKEPGAGRPGDRSAGKKPYGARFGDSGKFGGKKFGGQKPGGKFAAKPFGKPKGDRKPERSQDDQEA